MTEFKTIKFPSQGTVFDFYIDSETKKIEPWSKLIPKFEFDREIPLQVSNTFMHIYEMLNVKGTNIIGKECVRDQSPN